MSTTKKGPALSDRLAAIASMVAPGKPLIDIGTDHAYIPVKLCAEGTIPSAVAADINAGPLAKAEANIFVSGLAGSVKPVLSDGLEDIEVKGGESAVIAGMGGPTIMGIIERGGEEVMKLPELILEPQSRENDVREFLVRNGFSITDETMVSEDGKYYFIMKAVYTGEKTELSDVEAFYGPCLLADRNPVLLRFLEKQLEELHIIEDRVLDAVGVMGMGETREMALVGIMGSARLIQEALQYYIKD